MTLKPAIVDRAYRFFLGRPPAPQNLDNFSDMGQLIQTLLRSKEYLGSARSRKSAIGWPLNQVFVVPEAKLMYCPIGKNGCTFFKSQMVRLSSAYDKEFVQINVHVFTDHVNTGLQLSDYEPEEVEAKIAAPDYMKFAILRDPADRLLSAWLEKFVRNRHQLPNQLHTGPVVAAVQDTDTPDFNRSISFGDFVRYVAQADPEKLDTHWRPQHLYLSGIDYTHLFRFDRIDAAIDALEEWTGQSLPRDRVNKTDYDGGALRRKNAADLLPSKIDKMPRIAKDCFLNETLRPIIAETFAQDYALIEKVETHP